MVQPETLFSSTGFLSGLSERERADVRALGRVQEFRRGEHVFRPGAPGQHVYILEQGRAKIYKLSDSGREVILWFCFPGEMFGLAEVSHGRPREVFAQVCAPAVIRRITRKDFSRYVAEHPNVALRVMETLSGRMRVLGDMLVDVAADDVASRVVKLILRLSGCGEGAGVTRFGRAIPLTHQEIADMVGTTRQTVTTVLNSLKRKGAVRTEHHCIHIQRQELLQDMVAGAQP